jgi:CRP/FNR family transcriptional regulator, cyclic AMP receptor protein
LETRLTDTGFKERGGKLKPKRRTSPDAQEFVSELVTSKKTERYDAGEMIISQGDDCSDVHYIEKGLVKLTLVSEGGKGAVLGILGQGDFFGETCIINQPAHLTSAVALVPCTIVIIKRRTMQRLIEEEPAISRYLINYLLLRNQSMQQDIIDHLFHSSEKRLARTLLMLAQYGKGEKASHVLPNISQDTLAEMIGTTRSRVNFFMNKFRKLGFIQYNGGLTVHDSLAEVLQG